VPAEPISSIHVGCCVRMVRLEMKVDVVLREIEELSRREYLPIIGSEKGKHLVDAVRRPNVKNVLEVGTLIGYSAILIASNLPQEGRVVTIEMKPKWARLAEENVRRAGLAHKIELHIGDALTVIPRIKGKFDMVFLDATKDEYLKYLELSEDKLETGGVVFADNVKAPARGMRDYLDYVGNSGRYRSRFIDVGFDAVEISTKLF
jgi:predicted O-methyltransferase YrrM